MYSLLQAHHRRRRDQDQDTPRPGGVGGEYAQGTIGCSGESGDRVERGAITRTARPPESAPHRGIRRTPMDVDRDRVLHRRSGSVGRSRGAVMTREPTPMDVDGDRALPRRSGCIGSSRGAVATARVAGGGQVGSTTRPSGEGDGGEDALTVEGRWSDGVNIPPSLRRGATPRFPDA